MLEPVSGIFDLTSFKMKRLKYSILILTFALSCKSGSTNVNEEIFKYSQILAAEEAVIDISINGKEFYDEKSRFKGVLLVNDNGLTINLKDQNQGNMIVNLEQKDWFKTKPYKVAFNESYSATEKKGSLMIGKLSSTSQNMGEGYVLSDGFFEVLKINKEVCYLFIKGRVKHPFNPDLEYPIEGQIIWKKPSTEFVRIPFESFQLPEAKSIK